MKTRAIFLGYVKLQLWEHTRSVFCTFGGLHKNFSKNFNKIDFFKQRNFRKNLVSKKNITGNITLSQTSRLNLDKFGEGSYIPDCRLAPFA